MNWARVSVLQYLKILTNVLSVLSNDRKLHHVGRFDNFGFVIKLAVFLAVNRKRAKMFNPKLLENFRKFSKTDDIIATELDSQLIHDAGLYKLDDHSYFGLIPNYLETQEQESLLSSANCLEFTQRCHKNSDRISRSTHYIGPKYQYSDIQHKSNYKWTPAILKNKAQLELNFLTPINSVLVNKYSNNQWIPFHQDNEACLGKQPTIFSLSVGENGIMTIKDKKGDSLDVELKSGSLLVMMGDFNHNYYHSVKKSQHTNKNRLNFTFRHIYDDDTTEVDQSSIKTLIEKISADIAAKGKEISEMKNLIQNQQSTITGKNSPKNNKIVILKCDAFEDETPVNMESCVKILNEKLSSNDVKLNSDDITCVSDYREKKGPIVLDFKDLSCKVRVLKNISNNEHFVIRDCLSKHILRLRKTAYELLNKKKIHKFWLRRGELYYSLSERGGGVTWLLNTVLLGLVDRELPQLLRE